MRILLISYYFPPFNSVGAVRPGKLARWLQRQGHGVHVLTCASQPFPPGLPLEIAQHHVTAVPAWSINAPVEWMRGGRDKVAREGYGATSGTDSAAGRLGRLYKTLLHWPDGQIGWVGAATRAGRRLLAQHPADLIYCSAPPFSGLRIAATLSAATGTPWVAELRDLWTDNHAADSPRWRHAIERRWEQRLLRSASALVTVSAPLVRRLQRFGPPVWEVRNGCDPEDFANLPAPPEIQAAPGQLHVVFTGNVYDRHYDVDAFCAGLAMDRTAGGQVCVHVAGRNSAALRAAAQRHGVASLFRFQATVPRPQALALQAHADLLLSFLWSGGGDSGVYSAKLFEYAGAGRPVLAVGSPNDVAALIEKSRIGCVCTDAASVAAALAQARLRKAREGQLRVTPSPDHDFSRARQFTALEAKLRALVNTQGAAL